MADRRRQGRHRRYRPSTVSRASLTVTAGGAGLALPLVGGAATPAAAAADTVQSPPKGRAHPAQAPQPDKPLVKPSAESEAEPSAGSAAAPQGGRAGTAKTAPYEVAPGDTLSGIAAEHRLRGGWPALYERNRRTIGGNPDLILPGQQLTLRASATAPKTRPEPKPKAEPKAKPKAKAKPKPKPQPDSKQKPKAKPKAEPEAKPKPKPKSAPSPAFTAPVPGADVGTPYGAQGSSWSSGYHTGADFPVSVGTGVRAVSGGQVVSAGWGGAYGYEVVVRHKDGKYSQYAHLSAITVRDGQQVNAGQRIGRSGSTGNTTGPHLHFEVRTGPGYGSDIDPLAYLRSHGVRL